MSHSEEDVGGAWLLKAQRRHRWTVCLCLMSYNGISANVDLQVCSVFDLGGWGNEKDTIVNNITLISRAKNFTVSSRERKSSPKFL